MVKMFSKAAVSIGQNIYKHHSIYMQNSYEIILLPSALTSFGPLRHIEVVGKWASARTEIHKDNESKYRYVVTIICSYIFCMT